MTRIFIFFFFFLFVAGCTVELYPPAQEVNNLPDGGKVDVLPDTIPRAFAFGPRIYWSQIIASDSSYSIAVTDANNKGRWLDSLRWVPSGPFVTVNGDTLSTRAYARENSGVAADNQVLIYNGSGSLTIEDGNTVDMSDLLDNTDAQTIDTLTLQGDTMLQVSLSGDGAPVKELDLSALRSVVDSTRLTQDSILVYYQDGAEVGRDTIAGTGGGGSGTDDQTLTYNGSGSLTIEDGNTVDMSDLLDNTDDQAIDVFSITSNTLNLSLENDGEATKTVSLAPYLDNTDDQTIDTFSLSGTTLSLSLESDGQAAKTVDLSALAVIDSTRLTQDSILVYYQDGAEVGRDTIAGTGTGGGGVVDSTRLVQDSILVYYQSGIEIGRDTISGTGGGGGVADNLGNHTMTQNLITNGNWISGDGGNEGISIDADGEIHASNSINSNTGDYFRPGATGVGLCSGATITGPQVNNQVIEITLPSAIFSSAMGDEFTACFQVTIMGTNKSHELLVNVAGTSAPAISANSLDNYVISLDGLDLTSYDWRIGHDGTDLKIWLGSLTGSKFTGQVVISNINISARAGGFTADDICNDWEIAAEATAYDTVLKRGKVGSIYNPLVRWYEKYLGNLGTLTMSGVVFARKSISANNSSEITIPVTANMVSDVIITMKLGISESTNAKPIQYGTLRCRLNMATKAWSNASFEWDDPGHINETFELRLGDDGTNLKIWVWPIGSTKLATSGIVIKDIVMSKYNSNTPPFNDFFDFTAGLNWTFANESVSYDNVDVTLGPYPGLGINTNSPSYILDINSTDAVRLPVGTTAQRPTGADGLLRLSSTNNKLEAYYNAQWYSIASEEIEDDGSASGTTDGSGDITVSHALGSASITVTATTTGTTFYHVQVHTKTSTTFKIRFFDATGAAVTATAATADWIAKLQ